MIMHCGKNWKFVDNMTKVSVHQLDQQLLYYVSPLFFLSTNSSYRYAF